MNITKQNIISFILQESENYKNYKLSDLLVKQTKDTITLKFKENAIFFHIPFMNLYKIKTARFLSGGLFRTKNFYLEVEKGSRISFDLVE